MLIKGFGINSNFSVRFLVFRVVFSLKSCEGLKIWVMSIYIDISRLYSLYIGMNVGLSGGLIWIFCHFSENGIRTFADSDRILYYFGFYCCDKYNYQKWRGEETVYLAYMSQS